MKMQALTKMEWHGQEVKIQGKVVVNKSAFELGLIVEGQAKELAPKDLGYLAASINTQSATDGTELSRVIPGSGKSSGNKAQQHRSFWQEMPEGFQKIKKPTSPDEVYVGTAVFYGIFQEFGTLKMEASPFLRPSLELARGQVITIVERNGKLHMKEYLLQHDEYLRSRGVK